MGGCEPSGVALNEHRREERDDRAGFEKTGKDALRLTVARWVRMKGHDVLRTRGGTLRNVPLVCSGGCQTCLTMSTVGGCDDSKVKFIRGNDQRHPSRPESSVGLIVRQCRSKTV